MYIAANLQQSFLSMEYRSVKGYTGWAQVGFLCVFLAVGILLAGGIQFLITMQIMPTGAKLTDSDAIMKAMLAPENVNFARWSQVLSTFALLFLPAIALSFICNGKSMLWVGFSKHISAIQLLLGFVIMFITAIAVGPLADISKSIVAHFPTINASAKKLEDLYNTQALALSNLKSLPEYIIGLFIMAFFPALFEEVFFRGTLQNLFLRWLKKPILAILITSILFSLVHSSIYLFLSRMALGFALGLMYYYSKNIWINIVAHFINNTFALTALYLMGNKLDKASIEKLDPHPHWLLALAACGVLVLLFQLLQKRSGHNKAIIEEKELALVNNNHFKNNT